MNCTECRELWVDWNEGLLVPERASQFESHLKACPVCRAEMAAYACLHERLLAQGKTAAAVNVAFDVQQRLQEPPRGPSRQTPPGRLLVRWALGLGAAAGVAALVCLFLLSPQFHATAAEVLAEGARAVARLTTVHLRGQVRASVSDNFDSLDPNLPFCSVEVWREFAGGSRWRVEKPQRVELMDGQHVVGFIPEVNLAVKCPFKEQDSYDVQWLLRIADLSNTLTNELNNARSRGWKMKMLTQTGPDGRPKSIVTIQVTSGVPDNDYGKNTSMLSADTRRVYHFDAQTKRLEAVEVYLVRPAGEVEIFALDQIDYNQVLPAKTWTLALPSDVVWAPLMSQLPALPDKAKYAALDAQQAARAFLEACGRKDWPEAEKFMLPVFAQLKQLWGGLEIVSVGKPFESRSFGKGGFFVPYEIKLPAIEFYLRVANSNAAGRYVLTGNGLSPQALQPLVWTNPPARAAENAKYARLSPQETVQAYFEALRKLDWKQASLFAPDYDVQSDRLQIEALKKQGRDPQKLLLDREAVEARWSDSESAWLVTCRWHVVQSGNLALRNDNPAHRWQVTGGY